MSSSRRREVLSPVLTSNLEQTPQHGFVSPSTSRHVPICSPAALLTTERDDKKEKMDRRRSRVLELQNKNLGSPLSPAERRKSLPLSGLTAAQLSEHYASCIKLSAENKINSKNAFGLHLIDYMSELLKKKELENFQVASSTLDASAKIYAGRVDAIHAETFKVLSGLGRGSDKPKENDETGGDEEQKEDGQTEQEDEGSQKKKRKIRKSKTVETNLKNINVNKLDLAIEVDPTFQVMSAAFDEGGTSGLLMNNLRCFDDSQELVLDSMTIVLHADINTLSQQSQQSRKMVDLSSIQDMFKGVDINSLQICEAFSSFTFTNWDGSDTTSLCIPGSKDHVFDMDAETEPIPENTEPNLTMIGGGDGSFSSDGDNDAEAANVNHADETMVGESQYIGDGKAAQLVQSALSDLTHSTTGSLMQVLATTPSDYSYFNKALLRAWAGPSHWKIGPVSRDSKLKSMNTTDKPKTKKAAFRMDFDVELDFEQKFKISKATCLTKATLSKYNKDLTTLPKDHHYDANKLFKLFLRKKIMIKRQEENSQEVDDVIDNYDYDNENDKENYCPNKMDGGDDDSGEFNFTAEGSEFSHSQDMFSQSQPSFTASSTLDGTILAGDKLLAQPYKVAKIDIDYAKTAKKLDVKRLKSTMWNVLTTHETSPEEAQNVNNNSLEAEKRLTGFVKEMTGSCTFQDLLTDLPSKLTGQTAKNISVPIAFVCLLHLANEKTLKLEDVGMDDLRITQGL